MLVKIGEKLNVLLREKAKSRKWLDREAVLGQNAVSGIVGKGYEPGVFRALAIARALGVSLDWLADDDQGLPPVPAGETLGFVRLLSATEREKFERNLQRYGRNAVLAAAVRLLCEVPPEKAGSLLHPSAESLDNLAHPARLAKPRRGGTTQESS